MALRREIRDGFAKVNDRFGALEAKMDQNQARIVELLTALVGQELERKLIILVVSTAVNTLGHGGR